MRTKKLVFLAILVSQAMILGYLEQFIPFPFLAPGAKLGLANVISLVCLYQYSWKEALLVQSLRVILLSFLFGNFASLAFSFAGVLFSIFFMTLFKRYFEKHFSIWIISLVGAIAHHIGQLFIASLTVQTIQIFFYLPILILVSIPTGIFIGLLAKFLLLSLKQFRRWQ